MSNEAKRIIRLEYGDSPHPITRNIEGYRIVRQANGHTVAVEISRGSNMENGPLWGASFAVERPDGTTDRLSMLRDLWESQSKGEEYHPKHETNLFEYGLSFDYVEPETFKRQPFGYWRYQLSWGGPSDEFRLYGGGAIEYWFLDWFDGAHRKLKGEDLDFMRELFGWFLECQEERHGF